MIKRVILAALLFVSVSLRGAQAQEIISLHADFDMYFDNKEFSKTNYAVQGLDIESGTDFYGRLVLSAEMEWERVHTLVVGADLINNYGENIDGLFSTAKPIIYYKYDDKERWKFAGGIFTNEEMHIDSYSTAFYSEESKNRDHRVSGVLAQYSNGESFVELICNWNGEYSESSREKFEILSAARHYLGSFYYGYNYLMYHFAGSMDESDDTVVDIQKINPCVGYIFDGDLRVDLKLGAIITAQHDRSYSEDWVKPMMGEVAARFEYRGFSFDERLYLGDNINPFFYGHYLDDGTYMEYGRELYPNESFFRTDKGIYNRAALAYNRSFGDDKLRLKAEVVSHYDGYGLGTQYLLTLNINLTPLRVNLRKEK
ncbi:MAG: hypothetical protein SNG02_05425 [Rikenellaceae bacterium]